MKVPGMKHLELQFHIGYYVRKRKNLQFSTQSLFKKYIQNSQKDTKRKNMSFVLKN